MSPLPLSREVSIESLVRGLVVITSIAIVATGCRGPLMIPNTVNTVARTSAPMQQAKKPVIEPVGYVKPVSLQVPANDQVSGLSDFGLSNATPVGADEQNQTQSSHFAFPPNSTFASPANSDLTDGMLWSFEALTDAKIDADEMSKLCEPNRPTSLICRMWDDQKNFYSVESLTLLGGGLIVGGAMANSSIDEDIHRHFQSGVRGATSDGWFESLHASKELGNGMYTLPVFATAWAASELFPENAFIETSGRWGERSLRGFVVGTPPLIVMQQLTGGSRPTETDESSEWHPFRDNNGISGHAFMGSLPFITAAKMTENRGYKFLFYAGSTMAPLSRVNDNAHYPSQVALGWWMAYLAASAIDATDNPNSPWRFYPYSTGDGSGMMAEFRY
ncbi:MAG: phosphatase PAP2 family protein [Planctomycetales bacterium]|nr:phosphatase PAP2 family protein [Planctomycetales bacterium]